MEAGLTSGRCIEKARPKRNARNGMHWRVKRSVCTPRTDVLNMSTVNIDIEVNEREGGGGGARPSGRNIEKYVHIKLHARVW